MTWTAPKIDFAATEETTRKALQFPIGAASPLWLAYAGMTGVGVTYWWMSQWTKPVNLEALSNAFKFTLPADAKTITTEAIEAPAKIMTLVAPEPIPVPEPVLETAPEPIAPVSLAAEPALAPEPMMEAMVETTETIATETVQAMVEVVEVIADDLTKLVGIGPKLSVRLAEMGVTRFAEIASWTAGDLAKFDAALDLKGRAVRESWIAQAKRYAADVSAEVDASA